MGFIFDLLNIKGILGNYKADSSKYTGAYVQSLKSGAMTIPEVRNGEAFPIDGDGSNGEGLSYKILLDTDVDQQYYGKNFFNRWRKAMPDDTISSARFFLFMTKPDLNILDASGRLNDEMKSLSIENMAMTHPEVLRMLSYSACSGEYGGVFLPIISNRCSGYDVPDITLKTQEFGETFRGWKFVYGRHTVDSRSRYDFSLSFDDNRDATIYNLMRAWVQYIEDVNIGYIESKPSYILNRILDYAVSVYFFIVSEDGESIIYYSKDTGVFPTSIPSSAYSMDKEGKKGGFNMSVQFASMVHEEMNPAILHDFNGICNINRNNLIGSDANKTTDETSDYRINVESVVNSVGTTWVTNPLVVAQGGKYKLKWQLISKE